MNENGAGGSSPRRLRRSRHLMYSGLLGGCPTSPAQATSASRRSACLPDAASQHGSPASYARTLMRWSSERSARLKGSLIADPHQIRDGGVVELVPAVAAHARRVTNLLGAVRADLA